MLNYLIKYFQSLAGSRIYWNTPQASPALFFISAYKTITKIMSVLDMHVQHVFLIITP